MGCGTLFHIYMFFDLCKKTYIYEINKTYIYLTCVFEWVVVLFLGLFTRGNVVFLVSALSLSACGHLGGILRVREFEYLQLWLKSANQPHLWLQWMLTIKAMAMLFMTFQLAKSLLWSLMWQTIWFGSNKPSGLSLVKESGSIVSNISKYFKYLRTYVHVY